MSTTITQPIGDVTHPNPVARPSNGRGSNDLLLSAVAWTAASKVAAKESSRDDLQAGGRHTVNLTLAGEVDGKFIGQRFSGVLLVGHDQQRATSATPNQPRLLAAILAKLNRTTREKVLRELPEEFASAGGQLPETDQELVQAAERMLQRLRAKKTVAVRGSVRCEYSLGPAEAVAP